MSETPEIVPPASAEVLVVISRLARKGAYAMPLDPGTGGGQYAAFSPRNAFARAIAVLGADAVAEAVNRGWLAAGGEAGRLVLTPSGVRAVRRWRSGTGTAAAEKPSRPSVTVKAETPRAGARAATQGTAPLQWLRRRRDKQGRPLVSEAQLAAGERLAADYWRAQLTPHVTANWSAAAPVRRIRRSAPGAGIDLTDGLVAARERVHRALEAVGPELSGILVEVCCLDVGLEAAARGLGWPDRAAKIVLQLALTRLARHYGLIAPEPRFPVRLRHWGDETYRPTLDTWR